MFGVVEILIIAVIVFMVVGPRRVASVGDQVRGGFRRMQASVTGQPVPDEPAPVSSAPATAVTAVRRSNGKGSGGLSLSRLWDLSNVIGFVLVVAGMGLIVADLNWLHLGSPALALGALLLAAGVFCLAW